MTGMGTYLVLDKETVAKLLEKYGEHMTIDDAEAKAKESALDDERYWIVQIRGTCQSLRSLGYDDRLRKIDDDKSP